jgi:hypothetical protein
MIIECKIGLVSLIISLAKGKTQGPVKPEKLYFFSQLSHKTKFAIVGPQCYSEVRRFHMRLR